VALKYLGQCKAGVCVYHPIDTDCSLNKQRCSNGSCYFPKRAIPLEVWVGLGVGVVLLVGGLILRILLGKKKHGYEKLDQQLSIFGKASQTNLTNITIQQRIGGGNFGEVYRGLWFVSDVIIISYSKQEW
jgi:hypothetical protein